MLLLWGVPRLVRPDLCTLYPRQSQTVSVHCMQQSGNRWNCLVISWCLISVKRFLLPGCVILRVLTRWALMCGNFRCFWHKRWRMDWAGPLMAHQRKSPRQGASPLRQDRDLSEATPVGRKRAMVLPTPVSTVNHFCPHQQPTTSAHWVDADNQVHPEQQVCDACLGAGEAFLDEDGMPHGPGFLVEA